MDGESVKYGIREKMNNEPNNAMQRSRLLVMDRAYLRTLRAKQPARCSLTLGGQAEDC